MQRGVCLTRCELNPWGFCVPEEVHRKKIEIPEISGPRSLPSHNLQMRTRSNFHSINFAWCPFLTVDFFPVFVPKKREKHLALVVCFSKKRCENAGLWSYTNQGSKIFGVCSPCVLQLIWPNQVVRMISEGIEPGARMAPYIYIYDYIYMYIYIFILHQLYLDLP